MKVYPAVEVIDGAGVRLRRYIGSSYLRELDPFLLLDEFKSSNPEDYLKGFPEHPHRGFQTLTYIIKGRFQHRDSTGAEGIIEDGWLQWMNAGRGVLHSEMPLVSDGFLWGFQLWLNNPKDKKMSEPFYYNFPAQLIEDTALCQVWDLASGHIKEKGFYPLVYLHVKLKKGGKFSLLPKEGSNTFVALSEGIVSSGSLKVEAPALIAWNEDEIEITAIHDAVFIVGSAKPLKEPLARFGPFVMNTWEEIEQTLREYREGRFA